MRRARLLAVPPIAMGVATAIWLITTAPEPAQLGGEAAPLPVRVITVAAHTMRPTATAWGNVRASETWVAVSQVQAEVIWRHPDLAAGRMIAAGTEVLKFDPTDYELTLTQARADLAAYRAEAAQLDIEAANTGRILALEQERLRLARIDLERIRALTTQGSAAQSRLDDAERATLLAQRTVAELENALALVPTRAARLTSLIARSQAAIARAQRSLDQTTLTAPFDLRVTEVTAERFQTVAPGQVVIRGDSIASVEVVAHLPIDAFLRLIGNGLADAPLDQIMQQAPTQGIDVTLSLLSDPGQTWRARVARIEGRLDARARTVPVVVVVDDPYAGVDPPRRLPLVPNMRVGIDFVGIAMADVISLPEAALHAGQLLLVDTDNRLELRPVTPLFAQDGLVIIGAGLAPGARVVLDDIAPAIPGILLEPIAVDPASQDPAALPPIEVAK